MIRTAVRQHRLARPRCTQAAGSLLLACLLVLPGGCASGQTAASPRPRSAHTGTAARSPGAQPTPGRRDIRTLAAAYLAVASPANRRLEHAVDGFRDSSRDDLGAAVADLRSEAGTERWFDQRLLRIRFPADIEIVARSLVAANDRRITLTRREARSGSLAELATFTARHRAADAAVEVYVLIIRRMLGLPPPSSS